MRWRFSINGGNQEAGYYASSHRLDSGITRPSEGERDWSELEWQMHAATVQLSQSLLPSADHAVEREKSIQQALEAVSVLAQGPKSLGCLINIAAQASRKTWIRIHSSNESSSDRKSTTNHYESTCQRLTPFLYAASLGV